MDRLELFHLLVGGDEVLIPYGFIDSFLNDYNQNSEVVIAPIEPSFKCAECGGLFLSSGVVKLIDSGDFLCRGCYVKPVVDIEGLSRDCCIVFDSKKGICRDCDRKVFQFCLENKGVG